MAASMPLQPRSMAMAPLDSFMRVNLALFEPWGLESAIPCPFFIPQLSSVTVCLLFTSFMLSIQPTLFKAAATYCFQTQAG